MYIVPSLNALGVEEPEVSQTETSVQLPTSSSNSEKHPTVEDENKPGKD